ncbi:hypothetical protein Tco_0528336 [Tanacetum coccineum]
MTDKYFAEYTGVEVKQFRDTLLQHMGNVKKSVVERTRHQRQYDRRVNKRQMQTQESKVDTGKALDAELVVTESNGTEYGKQDTSSRSGNDADADDANIKPVYDEEPMAKVQLTAECNVFVTGQQHVEQPEFNNEGRVDQDVEQSKTIEHATSLITQNADLKAQIQEKVFAIAALKNKLRKLKGNIVDTKWIPTGKLFDSCTRKADSDSTHGSSVDISKIRECKQTLDLSAEADYLSKPVPQSQEIVPHANGVSEHIKSWFALFSPMFDELLNGTTLVVSKSSDVHAANAPDQRQQQNTTPSTSTTVAADHLH